MRHDYTATRQARAFVARFVATWLDVNTRNSLTHTALFADVSSTAERTRREKAVRRLVARLQREAERLDPRGSDSQ